jgi:Protein of unknown function (DUF3102)
MKITTTDKSKAQHINSHSVSVKEIKKLHGAIIHAAKTSLDSAIRIGGLLTAIKDKLEHGQWIPWIEKNLPFSERAAQNYLRCFHEKDRLKNATDADLPLSVSGALALLSAPETELVPAPASRFAELHGQVLRAADCIDEALPCLSQPDMSGEVIVTEPEFQKFIHEQGIELADGDLIPLSIIGRAYEKGLAVTASAIVETLNYFNPARAREATA